MLSHEPSPSHLEQLCDWVTIKLLGYSRKLVRLYPADFLPRYNRITVELHNRSENSIPKLLGTVHREGSKIGAENFYPVPLHVPELIAQGTFRYEFLSFDSFNESFKTIRVDLTTPQEYDKRQLAEKYFESAPDLTKLVQKKWYNFPILF